MNATPMNLAPANTAPAQSAAGTQQDAASQETPFSQVLSSEIAHTRRSSAAREGSGGEAGADAASQAGQPAEAGADLAATATATGADPLAMPLAEDPTRIPEALLALGISPDQLQPAVMTDGDLVEEAPERHANILPLQQERTGRAPLARETEGDTNKARASRSDPALSAKADAQAAKAAATAAATAAGTAAAFSGQLAAARQAEAIKTRDFVSELASNPALRPAAQAPLEAVSAPDAVAAPRLAPTVGTPAWNQALGEKIVWMTASAQQSATLTLNPPNMGPLQIVLNVSNEQATASFFSAQPEVRQALEAAFPRLREMMNEAGIQLGQATVSADTPQQNDPSDRQAQRVAPPFAGADETVATGLPSVSPVARAGRGLIDTFA